MKKTIPFFIVALLGLSPHLVFASVSFDKSDHVFTNGSASVGVSASASGETAIIGVLGLPYPSAVTAGGFTLTAIGSGDNGSVGWKVYCYDVPSTASVTYAYTSGYEMHVRLYSGTSCATVGTDYVYHQGTSPDTLTLGVNTGVVGFTRDADAGVQSFSINNEAGTATASGDSLSTANIVATGNGGGDNMVSIAVGLVAPSTPPSGVIKQQDDQGTDTGLTSLVEWSGSQITIPLGTGLPADIYSSVALRLAFQPSGSIAPPTTNGSSILIQCDNSSYTVNCINVVTMAHSAVSRTPDNLFQYLDFTTSSVTTISASKYYKLVISESAWTGGDTLKSNSSHNVYFIFSNGVPTSFDPSGSFSTIASTTPKAFGIVASSTSVYFGVSGFVVDSDFSSSSRIAFSFVNNSSKGADAINAYNNLSGYDGATTIWFDVTASGSFTVSKYVDLSAYPLGIYHAEVDLVHDSGGVVGWFVGPHIDATKSFDFNISTTTHLATYNLYDGMVNFATGNSNDPANFGKGVVTASPTACLNNIDIFDLFNSASLTDIVTCLFVPDTKQMTDVVTGFGSNLPKVFPVGYVTRFLTILTSSNSIQPPALSYKFGSSSPVILQNITSNDPIYFQIFDPAYYGTSSPLLSIKTDNGDGLNIWQVADPFVYFLVTIGVLFVVLEDLMSLSMPSRGGKSKMDKSPTKVRRFGNQLYDGGHRVKINDYSSYSEKEWQDAKDNRLI